MDEIRVLGELVEGVIKENGAIPPRLSSFSTPIHMLCARVLLVFEPLLTKGFEQHQRHAIREIEGAGLGVEHGNPQPGVASLFH